MELALSAASPTLGSSALALPLVLYCLTWTAVHVNKFVGGRYLHADETLFLAGTWFSSVVPCIWRQGPLSVNSFMYHGSQQQ
jgi:hypothetical protein